MQLSVTFKNLESSEHFKRYSQEKLQRLEKLIEKPVLIDMVLSAVKLTHTAEIRLGGGRYNLHASAEDADLHAAIDNVIDKMRRQINKQKEKIRSHRAGRPLEVASSNT